MAAIYVRKAANWNAGVMRRACGANHAVPTGRQSLGATLSPGFTRGYFRRLPPGAVPMEGWGLCFPALR
jgi:hypothetical protein